MPSATYFLPIEKVRTGEQLKKSKQKGLLPPTFTCSRATSLLRGDLMSFSVFMDADHPWTGWEEGDKTRVYLHPGYDKVKNIC